MNVVTKLVIITGMRGLTVLSLIVCVVYVHERR